MKEQGCVEIGYENEIEGIKDGDENVGGRRGSTLSGSHIREALC
jgi:hypothetical protein